MFTPHFPKSNETHWILDEKRRIAVNVRDLTPLQERLYKRNAFKTMRPDLPQGSFFHWKERVKYGECMLTTFKLRQNWETQRYHLYGGRSRYAVQNQKYFDEQLLQLTSPHIQGSKMTANRNWQDQSRVAAYVDKVLRRAEKYYLDYPIHTGGKSSLDTKFQQEDELTQLFIREMRKPPKQDNTEEAA